VYSRKCVFTHFRIASTLGNRNPSNGGRSRIYLNCVSSSTSNSEEKVGVMNSCRILAMLDATPIPIPYSIPMSREVRNVSRQIRTSIPMKMNQQRQKLRRVKCILMVGIYKLFMYASHTRDFPHWKDDLIVNHDQNGTNDNCS